MAGRSGARSGHVRRSQTTDMNFQDRRCTGTPRACSRMHQVAVERAAFQKLSIILNRPSPKPSTTRRLPSRLQDYDCSDDKTVEHILCQCSQHSAQRQALYNAFTQLDDQPLLEGRLLRHRQYLTSRENAVQALQLFFRMTGVSGRL